MTHRAVATRAGVSPGSTTHHFATREDLVREAFRYYLQVGEATIRALLEQHTGRDDPLARVAAILTEVVRPDFTGGFVRAEYELILYACTDPDLSGEVRAWEDRLVGGLAAALERGGTDRPMRAARTLVNFTRGYELEAMLDPTLTSADFRDRVEVILAAIAPSGEVRRSSGSGHPGRARERFSDDVGDSAPRATPLTPPPR